jgi:endoglucanase
MTAKLFINNLTIISLGICIGIFSGCRVMENDEDEKDAFRGYENFNIKKGINISHWLSQSNRRGNEREAFFTRHDVEKLAEFGFDHIRLPIDEVQMWDEEGNKELKAFELLHQAISWSLELGLKVIVDLHLLRSYHFLDEDPALWTDQSEQRRFVNLWEQLSDELKDYPLTDVAYELLNEPYSAGPGDWNRIATAAVEAIRAHEPHRKLIIEMTRGYVVPDDDKNIILNFHFYTPMLLTHYTASWWRGGGSYNGPIQYPGLIVDPSDLTGLPDELIGSLRNHIHVYNKEALEEHIRRYVEQAKSYDLPLYCGEWGAFSAAPEEMRMQWYSDVVAIMDKHQIAWAKWDYKGSFGILNRRTGEPHEELLNILLMKAD